MAISVIIVIGENQPSIFKVYENNGLPKRFVNLIQVGVLIFVVFETTRLLIKPEPELLVLSLKHYYNNQKTSYEHCRQI